MAWVPGACRPRHNGCQGVRALVWEQGGRVVRQVRGRPEHGVDGLQAPMVVLQVWDDPHLVVVAILQHDHGDGTGVTFARRGRCARRLRVVRRQVREVVPPATGGPAVPCLQALLQWDTEVVWSRWWGGPLSASGGGCGPAVRRRRYERVYPAQVWDPHAPLGRWWVLNHQIHASMRSSETCVPGVTSAWSCRTKIWVVGVCGRGTTAKSLFRSTLRRCSRRVATSSLEGMEAWMS